MTTTHLAAPLHVHAIHVYPVKSCAGISVQRARVLPRGLVHDRAFMVVRAPRDAGTAAPFVTQREHPVLATVRTSIATTSSAGANVLFLRASDAHVEIPLDPETASQGRARIPVRVWSDTVEAADLGGDAAAFFSALLGIEARLVAMPPDVERPVDPTFARAGDHVSFADGFPLLLAAEPSLADLNVRIAQAGGEPVPMSRFRANVVVAGGEPFAEERAPRVRIGDVVFRMPKRCARCRVTTVDQETGVASTREPLRTLASYRREGANIFFAQNLVPEDASALADADVAIAVGDPVEYLKG